MRVLLLSEPTFPRHPGGAGLSTHLLAAGLAARGHEVAVLCECHEADVVERRDGVDVHRVGWADLDALPSRVREPAIAERLAEYVRGRLDPASLDVLYDSGGFLSYFTRLRRLIRPASSAKEVVHLRLLHQRVFEPIGASYTAFIEGELPRDEPTQCAAAREADLVVCCSAEDRRWVERAFRPSAPVRTCPEPLVGAPSPSVVARIRERWGTFVLFVGRPDDRLKGGPIAVEAMRRVRAVRPDVRLVVMGTASEAEVRRIDPDAVACPWTHDTASVMAAAAVVLVPSVTESFGRVALEALAAGTPVVVSPTGAMPEYVTAGLGFLLESREWAGEAATAILALVADPAARARVAGADLQRYRAPAVAAWVEALLHDLLAAGPIVRGVPAFEAEERDAYLGLLERLRPGARGAGEVTLAAWRSDHADRCAACTHSTLARATSAMLDTTISHHEAVTRSCPLFLTGWRHRL